MKHAHSILQSLLGQPWGNCHRQYKCWCRRFTGYLSFSVII